MINLFFQFFILFRLQTNEDLPAPQKLLTAPVTTNRFGANEQTLRFSRPQQDESNSPVNGAQPLMSEQNRPYSRGYSTDRNENNNRNGNFHLTKI